MPPPLGARLSSSRAFVSLGAKRGQSLPAEPEWPLLFPAGLFKEGGVVAQVEGTRGLCTPTAPLSPLWGQWSPL